MTRALVCVCVLATVRQSERPTCKPVLKKIKRACLLRRRDQAAPSVKAYDATCSTPKDAGACFASKGYSGAIRRHKGANANRVRATHGALGGCGLWVGAAYTFLARVARMTLRGIHDACIRVKEFLKIGFLQEANGGSRHIFHLENICPALCPTLSLPACLCHSRRQRNAVAVRRPHTQAGSRAEA